MLIFQQKVNMSISGFVLTYGVAKYFSLQNSIKYATISSLLTFAIYSLNSLVGRHKQSTLKKQFLIGISIVAIAISIYLLTMIMNFTLLSCFLSAVFCFFCLWYIFPLFIGKKLRDIAGVKIFVIALTCVYAYISFPLLNESIDLNINIQFSTVLLLYFIAITLPFDIRDQHVDKPSQYTIPQLFGQKTSKLIGVLLLLCVYFTHFWLKICQWDNFVFHFAIGVQLLLLLITNYKRKTVHFVMVDLSIIFLGIAYLL